MQKSRALLCLLLLAPGTAAWPDDQGGVRQIPRDLLLGLREEVRPEGIWTLLGAGAAAGAASSGDVAVKGALPKDAWLGKRTTDAGAFAGNDTILFPAAAAAYLAGRCWDREPLAESGLLGLEALALSGVETEMLKVAVRRRRPDGADRTSFPSGHASSAFSIATVAACEWGWGAGAPAFLAAGFVGYTRMESNKHYLSDVVFGAGLGIWAARAVYKAHRRARSERVSWAPFLSPSGTGIAVLF